MARAALALHEASGDPALLSTAIGLANAARDRFGDAAGGFYTTAIGAADVPLVRPRSAADNATPSGAGLMAEVYARLYHLTGDPAWRVRTVAALGAFAGDPRQMSGMPTLLAAADLLEEATTVVIAGDPAVPLATELLRIALSAADPAVAVLRADTASALPTDHPAFGKTAEPGSAAAFVCRGNVCGLPVTDPIALHAALRSRG
jgi:uncharacterized protein YyaL (SSP411 family)